MYLMLTNVSEVGMIYQTPHIFWQVGISCHASSSLPFTSHVSK
jgi:hypothetical protein